MEGCEDAVFAGAEALMQHNPPYFLMDEIIAAYLRLPISGSKLAKYELLLQLLVKNGYKLYHLGPADDSQQPLDKYNKWLNRFVLPRGSFDCVS